MRRPRGRFFPPPSLRRLTSASFLGVHFKHLLCAHSYLRQGISASSPSVLTVDARCALCALTVSKSATFPSYWNHYKSYKSPCSLALLGTILRKILFLVSSPSNIIDRMVQTVQAQSKKNDISVIALDSSASAKLRKNNISHETPLNYLSRSYNDDALTRKAVALAKNWYEPFGRSLFFEGISLGEVVEYDFVFLFNDAIRSIEIAKEIMTQVRPDEVVLPGHTTFDAPNTTCYEVLSPALSYLAALKGIERTVIRRDIEIN